MNVYRDSDLKTLRGLMSAKDALVALPMMKVVDALPTYDPARLTIGFLHENLRQVGRALAHLEVGTWSYDAELSKTSGGHVIAHNYVDGERRLVRRRRYAITWNNLKREYLGWDVFLRDQNDRWQRHPMMDGLHRVAANNKKYPAKFGASRLMSWQATPKYAVIAAALKEAPIFVEVPCSQSEPGRWEVVEQGFQQELMVMSGEWDASREAALLAGF